MREETLLREFYGAVNRRELRDALAGIHPAFEWVPNEEDPEQEVRRGREACTEALESLVEALPGLEIEVERMERAGPHVLVSVRHRAHGRGSEAPIMRREVHAWRFRNGVATRLAEFPTWEAAQAALSGR